MGTSIPPVPQTEAYAQFPSEQITQLRKGVRGALQAGIPLQAVEERLKTQYGVSVKQVMAATPADFGRSIAQGLTLNHADELYGLYKKLTGGDYTQARDQVRSNEAEFVQGHPVLNAATQITAGAIPAMLAAPVTGGGSVGVLGNALRTAAVGAGLGAVAGEGASTANTAGGIAGDAARSAALGGVLGGVGGAVGAKLAGVSGPGNAVAKEAASQLPTDPQALTAMLTRQEQLAPGSVVLADLSPQMRTFVRAVGADTKTGMVAREEALDRVKTLASAKRVIGESYEQLKGAMAPVDQTLTDALKATGRRTLVKGGQTEVDLGTVQDLRSTLLAEARATRNTAVKAQKQQAANQLTDYLQAQQPWMKQVDADYAFLTDRLKAAKLTHSAVAGSSARYAANNAAGVESGSIGGSIPITRHGAVGTVLNFVTKPDRAARAQAIAKLLLTPQRDATSIQELGGVHTMLLHPQPGGLSIANALFGGAVAPQAGTQLVAAQPPD